MFTRALSFLGGLAPAPRVLPEWGGAKEGRGRVKQDLEGENSDLSGTAYSDDHTARTPFRAYWDGDRQRSALSTCAGLVAENANIELKQLRSGGMSCLQSSSRLPRADLR